MKRLRMFKPSGCLRANASIIICGIILAANMLLFLSQHFPGFNAYRHKGWVTLCACLLTAVALMTWLIGLTLWRRKTFCKLTLATAFWITATSAIPIAWLAFDIRLARRQQLCLERIQDHPGSWFRYDISPNDRRKGASPFKLWLVGALGDDFFSNVVWLDIAGTSGQLDHLSDLKYLFGVNLCQCQLTDESLQQLSEQCFVKDLCLDDTPITDRGLPHLFRLKNLQHLWLRNTRVSAAGVRRLERELPNCRIWHSS